MSVPPAFDSKTKTWKSVSENPLYHQNVSIGQVILNALSLNPDKIGQISDNNGIELTNREIQLMTIRAAQNLQNLGYGKNDVVGFYGRNSHHLAPIVFATLSIGITFNPIDPNYLPAEIVYIFGKTMPKIIFCDHNISSRLKTALSEFKQKIPIYTFEGHDEDTIPVEELFKETGTEERFVPPPLDNGLKDCAMIVCSSGSTGSPKAVCLSHAGILNNSNFIPPTSNGVYFSFSTLHWLTGLGFLIMVTIKQYQRIITTESYSPQTFLNILEKYKVSTVFTPPSSLALLLKHPNLPKTDLSNFKYYLLGGSPVAQNLMRDMKKYIPNCKLCNAYGISEASGGLFLNISRPHENSVGVPTYKNLTIKIVGQSGQRLGINEDGEICYLFPQPFLGYRNDEKATRDAFDEEGYYRSGDIGHFDDDGYLFIVNRTKELLKYMNYQVAPSEIETLISNYPGIHLVSVVGIPDPVATDLPAAIIVRNDLSITEDDIRKLVKDNLSDSKQLRGGVYFVDEIPLTSLGKILKTKVQEMAIEFYKKSRSS